ncbi:D-alanyl-D-alanine carboxypeptidase/D-alanyl-D-alanine-endopeptidase [Streptomyces sp. N2-109]|uniref:D-alanyl-D-alanine carboxypeptidase/D-alanyl-D-alanine-endopeptidase n=1 Tax=Streptomyces gossypii TaxID=2883101 RepID=A0ABT2JQ42_9ACTN|nr:D-alanyl-D-alanine carboxypeptidase/D-alanyl-D-alanine-endopeptidase [Streptomyces gossypii]MCT2590002.1 D-alanyl-D-alanine carboxypeptidase/D-alanyl-D-alanine-endopeptidase [Streptomyces gossypii]
MRDRAVRATAATVETARAAVRRTRRRWRAATPQQRQTWRLTAGSAAVGLVVAIAAVTAAGPWDSGQRTAERARAADREDGSGADHTSDKGPGMVAPAPSAHPVLPALGGEPKAGPGRERGAGVPPPPTLEGLADALEPLMEDAALGPVRTASVVDAASGRQLLDVDSGRPVTPASTIKLATAVAALSARGPEYRIETRVVRAGEGKVILVGGGDPTLSAEQLDKLARDTARALKDGGGEGGAVEVSVGYDTSLYSGPARHSIGVNENLALVTPLMVNEGRLDESRHGPAPRAVDPAPAAARAFTQRLTKAGVKVTRTATRPATAPKGAEELAAHRSAPLAALAEQALTHSDNDIAEALARQTALADGAPASFEGADEAVRKRLAKLGLPVKGARFADGSGLSRDDRVPASLLTSILAQAVGGEHPELRPVLSGLPVAGFTGTLKSRYPDAERGAGLVRAKTGTLTGVNTLAGTVVDADGRQLVFAFMTTGTTDRQGAGAALDKLASSLANCGCR